MSINCEKCGKEIEVVFVREFCWDGSDQLFYRAIKEEYPCSKAIIISASPHWVGADDALLEEEFAETIQCPHCGKFPFKSEEVQVYPMIQLVCFKEGGEE